MSRYTEDERHGMYWRNEYGRYYHGKWMSMKQECCGCFLWGVLGFVGFVWFVFYLLPRLNS